MFASKSTLTTCSSWIPIKDSKEASQHSSLSSCLSGELPTCRFTVSRMVLNPPNLDLLEVMVPKNYDKKTFDFFESFRKDSCPNKSKVGVVNIKKKSNFYYDAGRMMAKLLSEELTFVRLKSLEDFYNERIIWIINRAIDTNDHENVEPYSKRFTYSENRIYREVFKNAIKHKDWEQRIKKRVGRKTLQDLKNGK